MRTEVKINELIWAKHLTESMHMTSYIVTATITHSELAIPHNTIRDRMNEGSNEVSK